MDFLKTRTARVALLAASLIGLLLITYQLRVVFTPLLLAFILAYILDPFVDLFETLRLSRAAAIGILYALTVLLIAGIVGGLVPFAIEQVEKMGTISAKVSQEIPKQPWFQKAQDILVQKAEDKATPKEIEKTIKKNIDLIFKTTKDILSGIFAQLGEVLNLVMYLFLVPLYTFFFLLNYDKIIGTVRDYLPGRYRDRIVHLVTQVHLVLSSFFRGRLIIGVLVTMISWLGLLLAGCPLPFLFAALTGVIIIIPFASILVVLVAALLTYATGDGNNLGGAIAVLAIGLAVQAIEAYALTPWIIGKQLELHFVTIIVSVFVFGELLGFFGVLLSVPLAAVAKILGREFLLPTLKELAAEKPAKA